MADNKKAVRITTPKGVAQWPCLQEPDFKFKPEIGEYRIKLVIASGYESLQERLDELLAEALKTALEDKKNAGAEPYTPYEINEDGALVVSFKCNAQYTSKKDGTVVKVKPALVDGKGIEIKKKLKIGSGSIVKVNFEVQPYCAPGQPKKKLPPSAGISLRLKGVQLCKLVEWGNTMFGADEDAEYEYNDEDETEEQTVEAPDGAEVSDEEDF